MLAAERRQRLARMLDAPGHRHVAELARELGVSLSTVRRDLQLLQTRGLATRVRGGAAAPFAEQLRPDARAAAKQAVAHKASTGVVAGSTIMMLAGSTTQAMVPFLAELPDLTVVTNGLDIANSLVNLAPHLSLVVLGGMVHQGQRAMLGPLTDDNMRALHADVLFAGAWGVTAARGVTGSKVIQARREANADRLLEHVDRLVVVCDGSKIGRDGPAMLTRTDQIDELVTDASAPRRELRELRAAGVRVHVCRV